MGHGSGKCTRREQYFQIRTTTGKSQPKCHLELRQDGTSQPESDNRSSGNRKRRAEAGVEGAAAAAGGRAGAAGEAW